MKYDRLAVFAMLATALDASSQPIASAPPTEASKSLLAGDARSGMGADPGFSLHIVQARRGAEALENTLSRAEAQLAPESSIPAFYDVNVLAPVINFSLGGPGSADGYFPNDDLIPGLQPAANGTDNIAMEILTYLDLSPGIQRFGVRCDDGYKLVAQSFETDSGILLAFHDGGPADDTVDVMVPQAGFYPFRMIWYQSSGAAFVEWFSVDLVTGAKTMINDPNFPNSIKAYTTVSSLRVEFAPTVSGPFRQVTTATMDEEVSTITVDLTGNTGFVRLRFNYGDVKITGARVDGKKLVLSYSISL